MYKKYLNFAKKIANHAGKVMSKYFNENNGSFYKNDKTIVTKADTEINHYLNTTDDIKSRPINDMTARNCIKSKPC